jgi:hypothetical protein
MRWEDRRWPDDVFEGELEIVWLKDPLDFPYLREFVHRTTQPRGRINPGMKDKAFVVGYIVKASKRRGRFSYARRFWWLKKADLNPKGTYALGESYPFEAVLPASIAVGKESQQFYIKAPHSGGAKILIGGLR